MLKAKEILRLKHETELSFGQIGQAVNVSKSTVSQVLSKAEEAKITWPTQLGDLQLMSLLYPRVENKTSPPEPDMEYVFNELKRKNVTRMLLWEEYKEKHPDGIMYTQFCDRYQKFKDYNQITMHKEHKAGEEMEVDWAGSRISYTDSETKEPRQANIFVAVLPASSYPFVYAYEDMKIASWIDAHIRAYEYFGGVPKITIPDNTKTAVVKADRFDPVLNKSYLEMARHYGTTIVPARPAKPRDKGSVENTVGNVSRRIIAPLRDRQFFSLNEVNQAVSEELEKLILKPFAKMEGNRQTAFEKIDKPALKSFPIAKYEYSEWKEAKVGFNYHVEYDRFFYSVPYSYAGKACSIRATSKTIEIYIGSERVALHPRNYNTFKRYKTLPEHMPENHKAVSEWNPERFLSWASQTGPATREFVRRVLGSREYPVQTYRTCMGIMRLKGNYPDEIIEAASKEAIEKNIVSYKYFSIILKQAAIKAVNQDQAEKIIKHNNLRGLSAFLRGGINA